jgi:hypothetical protein
MEGAGRLEKRPMVHNVTAAGDGLVRVGGMGRGIISRVVRLEVGVILDLDILTNKFSGNQIVTSGFIRI